MKITKHFELNEKGRDFCVGDLHGMLDKLIEGLQRIEFDPAIDRMFSVGDLIDRGPNSYECIKLIEKPWFFANRGNHEELMLANLAPHCGLTACYPSSWIPNGGDWYQRHVEAHGAFSTEFIRKVGDLPLISVVQTKRGRINIVHAEFPDGTTDAIIDAEKFSEDGLQQLLWGRKRYRTRFSNGGQYSIMDANLSKTYVGHTPTMGIIQIGKIVYIDTGAVFPGYEKLTIVEL